MKFLLPERNPDFRNKTYYFRNESLIVEMESLLPQRNSYLWNRQLSFPESNPGFRHEIPNAGISILAALFNLDFGAVAGTEIFWIFLRAGHNTKIEAFG